LGPEGTVLDERSEKVQHLILDTANNAELLFGDSDRHHVYYPRDVDMVVGIPKKKSHLQHSVRYISNPNTTNWLRLAQSIGGTA
jgi:hypothetical protein